MDISVYTETVVIGNCCLIRDQKFGTYNQCKLYAQRRWEYYYEGQDNLYELESGGQIGSIFEFFATAKETGLTVNIQSMILCPDDL